MRITAGMATAGRALALGLMVAGGARAEEDSEQGADNATRPYEKPSIEGLHWAETFDGDVWSRWANAGAEKYNGRFKVEGRKKEALIGDLGLLVPDEARHYGVAATFPPLDGKEGVPFVVQFEARFQEGLSCGGSYIKLYDSGGKKAGDFKDDTPYVIMFGPDRCGATDKVHFILQHRSPKTGKLEEKHCKEPPSVPHDQLSHLYRLVIMPDNSFEIHVDGEKKTSGNLLTSMEPPVNPPKEIDDPTDSKPGDWVDEAKMDDPASSKPDDWDEDAPMMIADPKASMPSGWREDEPKQIADPTAKVPEDWDEDEDGEWEAPIIENPACKVGCGPWEAPHISNPAYKGKWHAPKIDNPAYKGIWKPRQIANPDYFLDEKPCVLPRIDAVGIDIWTMSKGIMFDNIVLSTDVAKAEAFAAESWAPRYEIEKLQEPKPPSSQGGWWELISKNLAAVAVTGVVLLVSTLFCCMRRGSGTPPAPKAKASSKKKAPAEGAEGASKEGETAEQSTTNATEKEEAAVEPAPKPKPEGGLGDISASD